MYKYLDLVHVMCYDYHGKWDKKTGHNAPLYSRPEDTGKDAFLNVEHTVKYLMKKVCYGEMFNCKKNNIFTMLSA